MSSELDGLEVKVARLTSTLADLKSFRKSRNENLTRHVSKSGDQNEEFFSAKNEGAIIKELCALDRISQWTQWASYVEDAAKFGQENVEQKNWLELENNILRLEAVHNMLKVGCYTSIILQFF